MNPLLVSLLEQYSVQVQELMDLLEAKRITPAVWRDRMGDLLARYHVAALMVGMGQTAVPTEGIALLAGNIANQFGYLDNFATEVAAAEAFRAVWRSRAQMYVNSAGAEFWEGYVYRQAGRFLPLPAMPKDGTTQCLSNCKCSWDIQVLDAERGDYDATWVMHPAEHCQTCIERAAQWAPLQIRDGMLMETAVKHLPGQHDQMTHGGGGSLGRFENWAAENMTSSQISHVRNGLSAMTDEQREEFFTDAMANMREHSSHDALRDFMLKRTANVGEDSGEERIGTLNGTAVMRVNGKFSQMPAKGDGIVVGVSGYGDRGTVAYGSASDGHSRIVSMLNGSLDNYVRMIWEGGSIYINSATAGAVDRDRAFRNIYRALDMLHAKGIPANTPVSIWDAFEGNKYIETTVKEFRALEKAKRLKHLPGQHDQMTHGGSGLPMKTAGANLQTGYAGMREGFNLTSPHGKAQGYLYDADFPGDRSSRTRGELFYVEVARGSQGRGHGRSLAEDSLRAMLNHGAKTVNMSAVTDAGRGLIRALERDGAIRFIRESETGKVEYEINPAELG